MTPRTVLALTAAVVVASASAAAATAGQGGQGTAVDIVGAVAVAGPLTIAGAGLTVGTSLQQTPGTFSSSPISGGVLAVSDLRASDLGWYVTATYSGPPPALSALNLGGSNIQVTTSNVVPDLALGGVAANKVTLATDQDLSNAVTVASTGSNAGSGLTAISTSYKVRIPATASATGVYAGTVTYTVASVR
jgi:hypothetical protein